MTARGRGAIAAVVVAALLLGAPGAALAKSFKISAADVSLRLAGDAALLVTERLTFDFDGSFEGAYRDIPLRRGASISDVSLREKGTVYRPGGNTALGSRDSPGAFGATLIDGNNVRVVWHYRASDQKRTFILSYRVTGEAVAYDDVIDVYWAVWGEQWDFDLDSLTADLRDPALVPTEGPDSRYRVFGHPREVEGATSRAPGMALLRATTIPDHTRVELRVLVPRTPGQDVSGARIGQGNGLGRILAEEKATDESFSSPLRRLRRFVGNNALEVSIALLGLAVLALVAMARLAREHDYSAPEHLPEPPDNAPPALAYALAREGADSNDTVLATLLDLVDRGYYSDRQAATDKEKLDLALSKNPKRPPAEELEPYEQEALGFFDELIGDETIAISDLRDQIPEHSATWRSRWESMTSALDSAGDDQLSWDRNLNPARWWLALGVLGLFAVVVICAIASNRSWFLASLIGLITMIVVVGARSSRLKRLDRDHGERSARWRAFKSWTEDFPRLEDDPPATLELWRRILGYGVAFGTAERMIKSGRIPAPVLESAGAGWSGYALSGSFANNSLDGGSFSGGLASQVAPESSSSGGGGGFSGGGGGGGGGAW